MRLSEWRKKAPSKESLSSRVLAVLKPVLVDMGAEADAECWVAWGDDPEYRYSILAPTLAGLVSVAVRLSGPDEGPRVTARLIRWPKVAVTELGIEASGSQRIVAVQVDALVLKGVDDEADRICEFVRELIASIDDRNPAPIRIAVRQGVAGLAGAVPDAGAAPPDRPAAAPTKQTVPPEKPAAPKPSGHAARKAPVATARKPVRTPAKPAPPASGSALVPVAAPVSAPTPPEPPAAPEPPAPRKPIAERAAAAHHGDQPAPGPTRPAPSQAEPEPDQPEWVGPHPIEEAPSHDGSRPRPWTP
jgi:hypothetical protein